MQPQIVGIGDNVLDRYVDLALGFAGGSALNFAVAAQAAGARAKYIGTIASDRAGQYVFDELQTTGVDVSRVIRYDGPQATTDVRIEPGGNRTFLSWTSSPVPIELDDDALAHLATADLIHTGHSSLMDGMVPDIAARTAVSFDFSYRTFDEAQTLLPHLTAASFSAAAMPEADAIELAQSVVAAGPRIAILTRGPRGAVVAVDDRVHVQPAAPVEEVIDTLGAGDVFAGVLLVSLWRGVVLAEAANTASVAAATVCGRLGAFGRPAPLSDLDTSGTRANTRHADSKREVAS